MCELQLSDTLVWCDHKMVCQMQQWIRLLSKNSSMHENTCRQGMIWLKVQLSKMFKVCYLFFSIFMSSICLKRIENLRKNQSKEKPFIHFFLIYIFFRRLDNFGLILNLVLLLGLFEKHITLVPLSSLWIWPFLYFDVYFFNLTFLLGCFDTIFVLFTFRLYIYTVFILLQRESQDVL